jgi:hypothetical protein
VRSWWHGEAREEEIRRMVKRGLGEMKIAQKNTKERSIEKWGEIGLKRWRVKKRRIVRDNEKGICFHSRSAGS